MLHSLKQRANAATALVGHRPEFLDCEYKFLVLRADTELRALFAARLEPRDEFVTRFDRPHIELITSHLGFAPKGRRPYTAPARESNRLNPLKYRAEGSSRLQFHVRVVQPGNNHPISIQLGAPASCRHG